MRFYLYFAFCLLYSASAFSQFQPLSLTSDFKHILIGKNYLEVAEDESKALPFTAAKNLKYELSASLVPNFGFKNSSFWFHFAVINNSGLLQNEMVEVKNPNLDIVSLVQLKGNGDTLISTCGDYFPFSKRTIVNKYFQFPVSLSPGERVDFYLNAQNSGEQFHVPLSFGDAEFYVETEADEQMIFGMYFGCILFVLALNIFFYLVLKDRSTLFYIGYLATLMMLQLSLTGIGFHYLWPNSIFLANHANPIFASASLLFLAIFTQQFLRLQEFVPRMNKLFSWLRWWIVLDLMLAILPFNFCYVFSVLTINVLALFLGVAIIPISIKVYRNKYKPARFFIVAFIVLILSVFLFVLKNAGIMPPSVFTEYGLQMGSALEVLLLSLAVIDRFRQFQADSQARLEEVNKLKTEANVVLEKKVEERTSRINKQKAEIEEINKEILSSIRYAKRIQEAILPPPEIIQEALGEHFVYYNPRDIVSGDFYWVTSVTTTPSTGEKRKISLCAVADCTGHGVPGAFMSLIGSSFLKQSAHEQDVNNPAEALDFLNTQVIATLNQSPGENRVRDGMDISFVAIDRERRLLQFAGANNPVYIIRNGKVIILKADKQAIGSVSEEVKKYTNHTFQLEKNDWVYLFTDGFADQFGGPDGKKFKYKQLQELLGEISVLNAEAQKTAVEKAYNNWKGTLDQIDDVCLIGIKI